MDTRLSLRLPFLLFFFFASGVYLLSWHRKIMYCYAQLSSTTASLRNSSAVASPLSAITSLFHSLSGASETSSFTNSAENQPRLSGLYAVTDLPYLSPLPLPRVGHCQGGRTYRIASGEDLRTNHRDLECIFQLGTVPTKPPVGMWYGGVLSLLNSGVYSQIGESVWLGKMGMKTQCRDTDSSYHMIMNFIFGDLGFPAYVYLGTLRDPILNGEVDNGRPYLFVDYTVNFSQLCPVSPSEFEMNGNIAGLSNGYFVSSVVDVARVVGYTPDGGQIILGKTFFRDIANFPDIGDMTIAWWFVVNYDSESYPVDLSPGQDLGPVPSSYKYYYRGLFETFGFLSHFLGLEGLRRAPLQTLQRFLYFLFLRPVAGLPPFPGTDVDLLTSEWPLAGVPEAGYELDQTFVPPGGPITKSGRLPGLPNPLGMPLSFLEKMAALARLKKTASQGFDSSSENAEEESSSLLSGQAAAGEEGTRRSDSTTKTPESIFLGDLTAMLSAASGIATAVGVGAEEGVGESGSNVSTQSSNGLGHISGTDDTPLASRPGSGLLETGAAAISNLPGGSAIQGLPNNINAAVLDLPAELHDALRGFVEAANPAAGGGSALVIPLTPPPQETSSSLSSSSSSSASISPTAAVLLGPSTQIIPLTDLPLAQAALSDLSVVQRIPESAVKTVGGLPGGATLVRLPDALMSSVSRGLPIVEELVGSNGVIQNSAMQMLGDLSKSLDPNSQSVGHTKTMHAHAGPLGSGGGQDNLTSGSSSSALPQEANGSRSGSPGLRFHSGVTRGSSGASLGSSTAAHDATREVKQEAPPMDESTLAWMRSVLSSRR